MIDLFALSWGDLHRDPRHRLEYPSEHVVRWLAGVGKWRSAIDIGAGGGRHANLFRQAPGARTIAAVDIAGPYGVTTRADMGALPYTDGLFDLALSYGVFYYGTKDEHRAAIAEMHRVLRPGGRALVCLRRHDDWRAEFTYYGTFHCANEPEDGMPMHFVTEYEVRTFYAAFTKLELNWTKTTRGTRCDADWLLSLTK